MSSRTRKFPAKEEDFNRWLVEEYFKYGSVDEVFRKHKFDIPISYAQFQRILDKWGIVKTAGPNSKLTEAIEFLTHLGKENIPFETLYKKMPPSFQTSASTLYRILGYVKEGITRRAGTALIITPYNNDEKILLARDLSAPRIELGKRYGALSIPMGYSRKRDTRKTNIVRILQQEVFVKKVIKKEFPTEVLPEFPQPFMFLDIADIRVAVCHIQLSKELSSVRNFSSYKLKDFKFYKADEILRNKNLNLRAGVVGAMKGYLRYLKLVERNLTVNPLQNISDLNTELAGLTVKIDR
jgi:hypothetical protein